MAIVLFVQQPNNGILLSTKEAHIYDQLQGIYYEAQATPGRGPSETEFIRGQEEFSCVASLGECQFGMRFDTTVLAAFETAEEFEAVQQEGIKNAFWVALNRLSA
jgi:hypothetical protein